MRLLRYVRSSGLAARLGVGSGLVAVLVVGLVVLLFGAERDRADAERSLERSYQALQAGDTALRLVVDVETGVRGLAITGERRFLQPYDAASRALPLQLRRLVRSATTERSKALSRQLRYDSVTFNAEVARRAETGSAAGRREAQRRAREGKRRLDALRAGFGTREVLERRALRARQLARDRTAAQSRAAAVAFGTGLLSVLVIGVLGLLVGVVRPLRRLTTAARDLRDGRPVAHRPRGGHGEARDLELAFDDMLTAVTDRDRRLRAAVRQHELVLAHLPGSLVALEDPTGRFLLLEGPMLQAQGLDADAFTGRTIEEMFPPEQATVLRTAFETAIAGGHYATEYRSHLHGTVYEMQAVPWRPDADGPIEGVLSVATDITARREAEREARGANEALAEVLDATDVAVIESDDRGCVRAVSPGWERATGVPAARALGRPVITFVEHDDRAAYVEAVREAVADGLDRLTYRHRYTSASGDLRWVDARLEIRRAPDGSFAGLGGILIDVTAREETRRELQSSEQRARAAEERFATAFAQSPLPMAFLDEDDRFTQVNAACTRLWGYPETTLRRLSIQELRVDAPGPEGVDAEPLATTEGDHLWAHRDGSLVVTRVASTPLPTPDGAAAQSFVQYEDITAQRRLETRLRHLAERDELTDLLNRRALLDRLAEHVARGTRYGHRGSLLLFDLDGFKAVNDTQGHGAGDDVLRAVAGVLRSMRRTDVPARLGGDEFAVLLPEEDADQATVVAAKLEADLRDGAGAAASIGVATFGVDGETIDSVMAAADVRMYDSKRRRRRERAAT